MNTKIAVQVEKMLTEVYNRLGDPDIKPIEERVREALEYLEHDREHYIEVAEPDVPEYRITADNGVVCKLIPLARDTVRTREKDHIREETTVFSLMVTEETVRYVRSVSFAMLHTQSERNSRPYPVYRYAELTDVHGTLQLCHPQQIRPAATAEDRKIYTMMFAAFDRCCRDLPLNAIPHKTERAMMAAAYALPEEVQVDGEKITGKVVPLGQGELFEQLREDHRYSCSGELCLLITDEGPRYLMKNRHSYHCFRKVIYDDVPGGCSYEPAGEKQEITYEFVSLEDIAADMHAYYY